MCLEKISEKRIAEEDIIVYKVLVLNKVLRGPYVVSGNNCVAVISDKKVFGKISIDKDGKTFICHNHRNYKGGGEAENMFGFNYSWFVDGYVQSVEVNHVKVIITEFSTLYRRFPVEIEKTYESDLRIIDSSRIEEGLHSFKHRPANYYKDSNTIFVKCIIPKGAIYYKGIFDGHISYASNKLTYLEIIE